MTTETDRRKFHFQLCLGRGGFGEVYLAEMRSAGGLRSRVAVKILLEGVDPRSQAVQRLRDEARLLAVLQHSAIPTVHDLVLLNGRVGLVSEYVEGADLEECIQADPPLSPRGLIDTVGDVADAIDAAYTSKGVDGKPLHLVHRDIKPANIRIGVRGDVKLLDFGIARAQFADREAKTQTNAVIGSFPYMPPERFDDGAPSDPRGDVFALGCVLYEGITGQRLFGDLSMRQLYDLAYSEDKHGTWIQERLDALGGLPPAVADLLRSMLAYEADDRPTAHDLALACEQLAPSLPGPSLRRWARARDWPPPDDHGGSFAGQTVSESAFSLSRSMDSLAGEPAPDLQSYSPAKPAAPRADWTTFERNDPKDRRAAPHPPAGITSMAPVDAPPAAPGEPPRPPHGQSLPPAPAPPLAGASPQPSVAPSRKGLAAAGGAAVLFAMLFGLVLVIGIGAVVMNPGGDDDVDPGTDPDEVAVIDKVEDIPEVAVVEGDDLLDPLPDERDTQPSTTGTTSRGTATTAGGSDTRPEPTNSEGSDAVVDVDTKSAPAADGCGDISRLETAAATARLSLSQRGCLDETMRNTALKQTERDQFGRMLLVDAKARCDGGTGCAEYEKAQEYFFEEVTRSDPTMMLAYASHLYKKKAGASTFDRSAKWAERALENKDQWPKSVFAKNVELAHQLRARSYYYAFMEHKAAGNREHSETRSIKAVSASIDWGTWLARLGKSTEPAMELCESAAGTAKPCTSAIYDDRVEVTVLFTSDPMGATVVVDGAEIGKTPARHALKTGSYDVTMKLGDASSAKSEIMVGTGLANRFTWVKAADEWQSGYH